MSILKKFFGGGASDSGPASESYEGFTITPAPQKEGPRWRVGARIEKDGKTHNLIRADMLEDLDTACATSIRKAKQVIDEQGDRLFG